MPRARLVIAATIAFAIPSMLGLRDARADDSIVMEGPVMAAPGASDCGCRGVQRPPWHGTLAAEACGCGPVGRAHGMFHADSCGQLHARRQVHQGHVTLPPSFPRLQALWTDGQMPSPRPPALPRCHQCGAVIAGGF